MSLSDNLTNAIDQVIDAFISRVSEEHDVDIDELRALWNGQSGSAKSTPKKKLKTKAPKSSPAASLTEIDTEDVSPARLMSCTVAELKALCRARGLVLKGKKADLISRLSGVDVDNLPDKAPAKKAKKSAAKTATASAKVIKALTGNIPEIAIRRNKHNNLEHSETGLVFDKQTKTVIGKQNDNGSVDDLTDDDIDLCKKFKFAYKVPDNLDSNADLANVEVEELEDSEEEVVSEEEESDIEIVLGGDDEDSDDDEEEEYEEYEEVTDED